MNNSLLFLEVNEWLTGLTVKPKENLLHDYSLILIERSDVK